MIKVDNLKKSYKKHEVLKGLTFHVNKGDIYGFLGQNGAGKSTTLNILTNLIAKSDGHVSIEGTFGYLPENPVFYDYMTAKEYLNFMKSLSKSDSNIHELLDLVGLKDKKRISTFSRGMKQRLGLASALISDPDLLILDEPSSALDPIGRKEMLDIIQTLQERGKTILLSSHILDDIERVCNKVCFLHNGFIQKEMSIKDLDTHTDHYIIDSPALLDELKTIKAIDHVVKVDQVYEIKSSNQDILKELIKHNIHVKSFMPKKVTLEDIFLRMVDNDL